MPLVALLVAGCGGSGRGPAGPESPWVTEARFAFPTALALHSKVIARSCAPTGGVCHNQKEYPDLHTPANLLLAVGRSCNVDSANILPSQVFDGCEPKADEVEIPALGYRARVAWLGPETYDPNVLDSDYMPLTLERPAPATRFGLDVRFLREGQQLALAGGVLDVQAGSTAARLVNVYQLDYPTQLALATVQGGDPNADGVFGWENRWAEVAAGSPERSYLLGRITGTVPGSRMPLANRALSDAEYVALFCWVETTGGGSAEQPIDYDSCRYARDPQHWSLLPADPWPPPPPVFSL